MADCMAVSEGVAEARRAFCAVNSYCLEAIVGLAQECDVIATCDIVDESGRTLVERGATLSRASQASLLQRRLRNPLEASLDVAQGVSLAAIVGDCLSLRQAVPALALLGDGSAAQSALLAVGTMTLSAPLKLLLTLTRRNGRYQNSLAAMIVCSGLAHGVGLRDDDAERLILAALVQNIGESYLDPQLFAGRRLLPVEQWSAVVAHPSLGQTFLRAFTHFPPALTDAVLHHHERPDGSGYPSARRAATIAPLATLLGLADCVAALVIGERATDAASGAGLGERVAVALNFVPDEFPPAAVGFVALALAPLAERGAATVGGTFAQRILPTLQRIRSAAQLADALSRSATTATLAMAGAFARDAIHALDARLRLTRVYDISLLGVLESDAQRMAKTCLVIDEVNWRLRHLARSIYLRCERGGEASDLAQVAELVAVLGAPPRPAGMP